MAARLHFGRLKPRATGQKRSLCKILSFRRALGGRGPGSALDMGAARQSSSSGLTSAHEGYSSRMHRGAGSGYEVPVSSLLLLHNYQGSWTFTSPPAAVMCGLIGRAPRTAGLAVPPFETCSITDTGKGWWASSLVEWLKLNGLYIESAGDTPSAAPTEEDVLRSVSYLTHSRRAELEHVVAAVRLQQGQCWIFELTEPQPPTVYEIMGFKKVQGELMVNLLAWQTTTPNRPIAPGDTVAMLETTHTGFHRGAASGTLQWD